MDHWLVTVPMCKLIGPASFLLLCNCIHTVQMCAGWEGFSTTTNVFHEKGQKVKCNLGQLKTTVIATLSRGGARLLQDVKTPCRVS